ncbi:hypothetical protein ACNHKD_03690 [Methylocystis sp. JAN1]|uniref:hypothetical protein n=1 Tax=Methylocystis sp. JAN1 TaxID=3397211 RepID=UPI003FA1F762
MPLSAVAVAGALCLSIALIEAWLLVALLARPGGALHRFLPNRADLVRSHVDYLMMALFLFVFYGLCRLVEETPATWQIAAACLGAFFNPFAFLVHAMRPDFKEAAPPVFFAAIILSCVATTIGFGTFAWVIAIGALRGW